MFAPHNRGIQALIDSPTVAIELGPRALFWQDEQGKVWLTYNSARYWMKSELGRHEIWRTATEIESFAEFLKKLANQATQ